MATDEPGGSGEEGSTHPASLGTPLASRTNLWPRGRMMLQGASMAELSRPDVRFRESFLEAMQEFVEEGRAETESMIGWDLASYGDTWHTEQGFAAYVEDTLAEANRPRRAGFVCQTSWWWTDQGEYVGRISLRHELTPYLLEVAGHIGYDVRRSRRRQGHGTRMLAAVLREAAERGIDPALVTCDLDNVASRGVIEANGGVVEDRRGDKLPLLGADDGRGEVAEEAAVVHVAGSIVIERPVEDVFDFVADQRNEPSYNRSMSESRLLTGEPIGRGSRFAATMRSRGRTLSMVTETTAFDRPRRLESTTTVAGTVVAGSLTFEPVGRSTRMSWDWQVRPGGAMRLLSPLLAVLGSRMERRIWAGLKRRMEDRPPSGTWP